MMSREYQARRHPLFDCSVRTDVPQHWQRTRGVAPVPTVATGRLRYSFVGRIFGAGAGSREGRVEPHDLHAPENLQTF